MSLYQYDEYDRVAVRDRAAEFRDQVSRRLSGALTEPEFQPLRLMNGLYLQLHAYMLRVAIPYGCLSATQMRTLAHIARTWDKGYGHFTTRQNIQFNWPRLVDAPDILDALAAVDMHAIQTSGNCIRNVTADPLAGVAGDELLDPRPLAEALRQWSTFHPEFTYLPRKFKFAVTGATHDRAAVAIHDIGIRIVRHPQSGEIGFKVLVGGGLGRTPRLGRTLYEWVSEAELFGRLEAALRVYNRYGRRDNKYKARIKILVDELGIEKYRAEVDAEWLSMGEAATRVFPQSEIDRIKAAFAVPTYEQAVDNPPALAAARGQSPAFDTWVRQNVATHKVPGYAAVTISIKPYGGIPGDVTADQMDVLAALADEFSLSELRVTREQNVVFPHIRQSDLFALWQRLGHIGLAEGNIGLASDIICCPGLDYCALANARVIPLAQDLSKRLSDSGLMEAVGPLTLNMSGCINACGHHHTGNIGILGVDRHGVEAYQITLGGDAGNEAAIGEVMGPSLPAEQVATAIEKAMTIYLDIRAPGETFIDTWRRVGATPFKEAFNGARKAA